MSPRLPLAPLSSHLGTLTGPGPLAHQCFLTPSRAECRASRSSTGSSGELGWAAQVHCQDPHLCKTPGGVRKVLDHPHVTNASLSDECSEGNTTHQLPFDQGEGPQDPQLTGTLGGHQGSHGSH